MRPGNLTFVRQCVELFIEELCKIWRRYVPSFVCVCFFFAYAKKPEGIDDRPPTGRA